MQLQFNQKSNRETNFLIKVPDVPLNISKCNFVYKSSVLWNTLIGKVLLDSEASDNGIVITGSSENSDFCASVPYVKNTLRTFLLTIQKYGNNDLWEPSNFLQKHFNFSMTSLDQHSLPTAYTYYIVNTLP